MEDFSLNFKGFILIISSLVFCLRNERFVVAVQKFCPKGSYWIKSSETLSFLVHFILFAICITFLLVKMLLSTVLKSLNFTVSLFGHIFKCRITIAFLRWPITATTITKRSTINREQFTNKKDLLTSKKVFFFFSIRVFFHGH